MGGRMIRCSRCLIPDTRPDTAFVDGVCSACISFAKRPAVDWDARKKELLMLLDRHDGRCIVPSSGGKDSTYQVVTLLELGADVTVVTATTCMLSDIGRANIDNLARYAKTIEVTPNRTVRAKLNRLGLTMVGDASWPQHASIWAIPFQMAVSLNMPLLIWGENSQDQYGGPIGSETARQMTRRWCSEHGGLNGLRPIDFVGIEGITARDMQAYTLPSDADIARVGVEGHFLGAYIPWDSHRNAEVAVAHGMQKRLPCPANWWDFENLDCLVTSIHDAVMYRKYGYGRGAAQISVDIRSGRVKRENALAWVRPFDGLFPFEHLGVRYEVVLDHIGISKDEFWETLDRFTSWELFDGLEAQRPVLREFSEEFSINQQGVI
jgi:N-acetyl sugar amidotransferase